MVNACKFTVDSRYSPLKPLGRGAYGVVCSATDKLTGRKVAIKKVPKAFDDLVDAKRILREIKLLRHFHHDNIVGLRDLIGPIEGEPFDDIYIVLDFMETDLHKIIYSKNDLTDEHIQYFIYQLLRGLKFIHSAHVIHRDLKPSNLLLNGNCDLKICDFGLARGVSEDNDYELTEYVVTRWYRAPEVMCSCQEYDSKLDVWSVRNKENYPAFLC
jgi:serine/threonine protein kinase